MIDFACKRFELKEIIKCSFGLTKSDQNLFNFLIKNDSNWYTTNELSKEIKLDLSTIQRSIKRLFEQELVERKQQNLSNGGYVFNYKSKNKEEIKVQLVKVIHNWTNNIANAIKEW